MGTPELKSIVRGSGVKPKQAKKNREKLAKLSREGRNALNTADPNGAQFVAEMLVRRLNCAFAMKGDALEAIAR